MQTAKMTLPVSDQRARLPADGMDVVRDARGMRVGRSETVIAFDGERHNEPFMLALRAIDAPRVNLFLEASASGRWLYDAVAEIAHEGRRPTCIAVDQGGSARCLPVRDSHFISPYDFYGKKRLFPALWFTRDGIGLKVLAGNMGPRCKPARGLVAPNTATSRDWKTLRDCARQLWKKRVDTSDAEHEVTIIATTATDVAEVVRAVEAVRFDERGERMFDVVALRSAYDAPDAVDDAPAR